MATISLSQLVSDHPFPTQKLRVSEMTAGQAFTVPLLGPTGLAPARVTWMQSTISTARDPVFLKHDTSLNSTANDTITLEPETSVGGDMTGAVVDVEIQWRGVATGGIGT